MLELSQFDLQLAFPGAGALGEDVQDEGGAIEDLAIEDLLEVAALRRGKFVIENDSIDVGSTAKIGKLVGFAFTYEGGRAWSGHFLQAVTDDLTAGSSCQLGKFCKGIVGFPTFVIAGFECYSYQEDSFGPPVTGFDQCFQFAALF